MSRRGRPKSERAMRARIVRIKLRLYVEEDDDLLSFFASIPQGLRAAVVKQALRSGITETGQHSSVDDDEVLGLLDGLVG